MKVRQPEEYSLLFLHAYCLVTTYDGLNLPPIPASSQNVASEALSVSVKERKFGTVIQQCPIFGNHFLKLSRKLAMTYCTGLFLHCFFSHLVTLRPEDHNLCNKLIRIALKNNV